MRLGLVRAWLVVRVVVRLAAWLVVLWRLVVLLRAVLPSRAGRYRDRAG